MSVALTYRSQVTVAETLTDADGVSLSASETNRVVTHDQFNTTASLTSATTPPVTTVAAFRQALTDGAATIDLTALPGTNGASVSGTGLKVQAIKFKALSTNANVITITEGASNGYALAGASWSVALLAGQEFTLYGNDATPDVAAGDKTIDLAGTGTQSVDVIVVLG